ncbi:hypothetical protein [Neisseria shayeganii]|uniref:Uncharacterized protein n=1 Tax=Neisseria shayeganii TaxID=607712 RepID=A0A7D7NB21_9NEIS|nr:hypothetical protein [Neisseria shayeganii]QMT41119.1 hypothetical protein H3L94_03535 [Neisseria shayeganii]
MDHLILIFRVVGEAQNLRPNKKAPRQNPFRKKFSTIDFIREKSKKIEDFAERILAGSLVDKGFGWFCVETVSAAVKKNTPVSAAHGRLCVETAQEYHPHKADGSAAFGRLCVETRPQSERQPLGLVSRLRAAVC